MRLSTLLWFILYNLIISTVYSKEVINNFHSHIIIEKNGLITVTETIVVTSENILINRGIYRDFPTQYFAALLTKKEVGFKVISVIRDNQTEPYHTEQLSNGLRVYMGSPTTYLERGKHQYQLTYQTDKQLGFFDDYDEFYWNVTGNGWQFDIIKATATIQLPGQGRQLIRDQQAWTGYQGEQNKQFIITNTDELLGFETTQPLSSFQGLTIGIQVPKGIFYKAPFDIASFLANNLVWIMALLVSLFYLGFFLSAWHRYGRDPEKGIIIARFYPPDNLSPAAVHYIDNEGVNDKTLTAGLMSLAVKGHITITQLKNLYHISKKKTGKMDPLSKGENAIKDNLFKGKQEKVILNKSVNPFLLAAKNKLNSVLKIEYQKKCFIDNGNYMVMGWVISLVCFFLVTLLIYSASMNATDLFLLIFTGCILLTIAAAILMAIPIFAGLFILAILVASYLDLWYFMVTNQVWILFTLSLLGLNLLFAYLMRSTTPFGRHIKDQIDGLKLYMKSAEENRLDVMNPPDKTLVYYEKLLPYAVALGLENQWAEKFSDLINTESINNGAETTTGYHPSWYQNSSSKTNNLNFSAASIGQSLKHYITASTTVKSSSSSSSSRSYSSSSSSSSSSSGSSSSGSSGGGGGGGGGGGW